MTAKLASKKYLKLARRFPLVPIRNRNHLKQAVELAKELGRRNDLEEEEHGYFLILSDLIENYEQKASFLYKETTPVEALRFLMEVNGRDTLRGFWIVVLSVSNSVYICIHAVFLKLALAAAR